MSFKDPLSRVSPETIPSEQPDKDRVEAAEVKRPRLTSLDAFRGLTVALMLLVNNIALGEHTPKQLVHAPWGEWVHVADLVFPWFLFCAGLSLPFSYHSAQKRGETGAGWIRKSLGRMISLFIMGLILDSAIAHSFKFGMGVLQLIAVSSFVAALVMPLRVRWRGIIAAALLGGYAALLVWMPIPGTGHAVFSESVNIVGYLNQDFFEPIGLRGLPSVIPTAALVILGTIVGEALGVRDRKLLPVFAAGGVMTVIAAFWSLGHPMSKAIWTPPYILFGAGTGTLAVTFLALLLDGQKIAKLAAPLAVLGSNPLVAYAGPILIKVLILQTIVLANGHNLQDNWLNANIATFGRLSGGWAYTLEYIAATWIILALMRAKNIALRL